MRSLPFLLLASFVLSACGGPPTVNAATDQATSNAAKPEASLNPQPNGPPQTVHTDLAVPLAGNPNRIHQLDTLKKVDLKVGGKTVHAWVMDDDSKREEGMMFLKDDEVKPDEGMIFVFSEVQPNDGSHGFWMHNTLVPLDIVYIDKAKRVVNVGDGKAMSDATVPPEGSYLYVLELKQGSAKRLGIKKGSEIGIPSGLKTAA